LSSALTEDNLTIAMITRNEARAVGKVITDIRAVVPLAEILVVDSSTDDTPAIAERLGARVVRQYPPLGYGPAMDLALRSARGRAIVTLDCDDTYPPDKIPLMAHLILDQSYDIVDGSRLHGKPAAMPWMNYLANWGFSLFASILFARRLTDLHSGMRAYRKSLLESLHYQVAGHALPVELLLRPVKQDCRLKVVPIEYRNRIGTTTMQPLESAWWTLRRILAVCCS
jgi:glycosyltransferase involved in cell wall biosynthesis